MSVFKKESLENLRQKIDLVEVLSSYVEFKRTGATYKGLCPFHEEKSPSFIIRKGDSHYHCFGCGAHGDAIQFLMSHEKMNFSGAVENLAQRFHIPLETVNAGEEKQGPNKASLKSALEVALNFYHYHLLHTEEGHLALKYLYERGIDLDFISHFKIGLAPKMQGMLRKMMHHKRISDETLADAGLISTTKGGQWRDFFSDRIMFPIHDYSGHVIGFSGRKYQEETFGGKYVNSPETVLFKKSRVLFGINYSRKRITKERKAIIVEGQIDALKLIQAGFNITVAGQGTGFGEGHVKELLNLGVNKVFLALDSDRAGLEAAYKIGNLFQKEGVECRVVSLPSGKDPDLFLREQGAEAFIDLLKNSSDYLTYLVSYLSLELNTDSPAAKNELIQRASKLIRDWDHPVMVHETLRKLAHTMKVPEDYIGVGREQIPNLYIKRAGTIGVQAVDADRILETDLLRWLLIASLSEEKTINLVKSHLTAEDFRVPICQKIFKVYYENIQNGRASDLLSLAIDLDDPEAQIILSELVQKRVNKGKAQQQVSETIQKILDRNWMEKREAIKIRIQSGLCSEEEVLSLAREFDCLKRSFPKLDVLDKQ